MGSQEIWTRLKRLSMQEGTKQKKPTGDMCVQVMERLAVVTRWSHWRSARCHNHLEGFVSGSQSPFHGSKLPPSRPQGRPTLGHV